MLLTSAPKNSGNELSGAEFGASLHGFRDGVDRRSLLTGAFGAVVNFTLGGGVSLRAHAGPVNGRRGKAHGAILVWLGGGPSNRETFDALPNGADERLRGPFGSIRARMDGGDILVSELWPHTASRLKNATLLKAVSIDDGEHLGASEKMLRPNGSKIATRLGTAAGARGVFPTAFFQIPAHFYPGRYQDTSIYSYFVPDPAEMKTLSKDKADEPEHERMLRARKGRWIEPEMAPAPGLAERNALRVRLNQLSRLESAETSRMETLQEAAVALNLDGSAAIARAFSPAAGQDRERYLRDVERYGRDNRIAEALLYARRLSEAGVGFVTVNAEAYGWDHHTDLERDFPRMAALLDKPLAALLEDSASGSSARPFDLIVMGEFGRTPRMNDRGGRDHWPQAACVLLAGPAYAPGRVYGATTPLLEARAGAVTARELHHVVTYGLLGEDAIPRESVARVREIVGA